MRASLQAFALLAALPASACVLPYESSHEGQWDAEDQVLMSDASQVRLRAAQSRLFETADKRRILAAVVATMQDEGFLIDVLDDELGIVAGKRFDELDSPDDDPTYHLYRSQTLLVLSRSYQTWGPFYHRSNLVRLTVTVRRRNEAQLVVRASAQFHLGAVEDPLTYQRFFVALEQALFLQAQLLEAEPR